MLLVTLARPSGREPTHSAATNLPSKASEEEIELLDSSTRTNRAVNLQRESQADRYQLQLETGRAQRENGHLSRAEGTFIQLLEGRAPEEIKRPALLDLALVMQLQKSYAKAQRLYSEYIRRYPKDLAVPEVLLRQAYLYREMGIPELALSKFFGVMSACLNLQVEQLDYYQKLVLRAQVEIADTYYSQGKFAEASDYLSKVLKLDAAELNLGEILYKVVRSYWNLRDFDRAVANARLLLAKFPDSPDVPETRFLLADSLKKLGHDKDAVEEILALLQKQRENAKADPQQWLYWQQRAGNDIANQFYRQGDFFKALQVYERLAELNDSPFWQLPVWYQVGLVHEDLKQYQKAAEVYGRILGRPLAGAAEQDPTLATIRDMARWRKDFLAWEIQAQAANRRLEEESKKDSAGPVSPAGG